MIRIILSTLFIIVTFSLSAKQVVDMAQRAVECPDHIERILPYDSKTSILLFPVFTDEIVATAMLPGKAVYDFISSDYMAIPEVDIKNIEEVISISPQVIIAGFYHNKSNIEGAKKLSKRLGIPVIFIDLSIDNLDETYRFLGELFGKEDEVIPQITFLSDVYHHIDSLKSGASKVQKSIYYTLGPSGLLTDPTGSKHTEVLDFLEIKNAAEVEIPSGGHAKVNLEQVLMWDPDYIFTASFRGKSNAYTTIMNDAKWKGLKAVRDKQVYLVPDKPFAWFDHPPSVNRIPGVIWLCQLFYGQSEEDTRHDIVTFYHIFYDYDLSSSDYNALFH